MTTAVALSDLSVSFFRRRVLHNVSAHFPVNRLSVLVGRSGSGKTTILRAINRLNEEFPGCSTSGQVTVDIGEGARDIYGTKETEGIALTQLRLRVGMLFQTPNCFPVSVYRNIAMPLALVGGVPNVEIADRVHACLKAVGLWEKVKDRLDAPAERLSGGQQQRLCLARLLALRPAVLLLDEPTVSLDAHATNGIEMLLRDLASSYTVIMISHSLSQARRLADRIMVCGDGRITDVFEDALLPNEDLLAELLNKEEKARRL
jgi:phosphate transport system ATP-binding protein